MRTLITTVGLCIGMAISGIQSSAQSDLVRFATDSIQPEALRAHMEFLADDLLEGRAAGTRGYELAARYVAAQFRAVEGFASSVKLLPTAFWPPPK